MANSSALEKALSDEDDEELDGPAAVNNSVEEVLKVVEPVLTRLAEEEELKFQKKVKLELREVKDKDERTRMINLVLKEGYLSQVQIDELMREIAVRDDALEKIYFEMGIQRRVAEDAIKNGLVMQAEADETILRSISDQIIEELLLSTAQDHAASAAYWLEWWKMWRSDLKDPKAYNKVNSDFTAAKNKLNSKSTTQAFKDEWVAKVKANRSERLRRSVSVRIPKISFSLRSATSILVNLRKEKKNRKSGDPPYVYWADDLGEWGGWCATGVTYILVNASGIWKTGNGRDWEANMRQLIDERIVSYELSTDPQDKESPRDGSVLVWNRNNQNHVCIVIEGKWVSDFITGPRRQQVEEDLRTVIDPTWVFIPVDTGLTW